MATLPDEFSELEQYVEKWAQPTAQERYDVRLASTMEEMDAFYDAMTARGEEAIEYLDRFDLDELTDEQLNLLWLLCSLSAVSFAVDCFKQPHVPDTEVFRLDIDVSPVP